MRLYPTPAQASRLRGHQEQLCELWNMLLTAVHDGTLDPRQAAAYVTELRQCDPAMGAGAAIFQRGLARQFTDAWYRHARWPDVYGLPREKKKPELVGLRFQTAGVRPDSNPRFWWVTVPKTGRVRVRVTIPAEEFAHLRRFTIRCDARGRWWLSWGTKPGRTTASYPRPGTVCAIDLGVTVTATIVDTTGNTELRTIPRPTKSERERRAALHRELDRRLPGSTRHEHARLRLARLEDKHAVRRRDFVEKLTHELTSKYKTIIFERHRVADMSRRPAPLPSTMHDGYDHNGAIHKRHLNRVIRESAWGQIVTRTRQKARARGGRVVFVDPAYTSLDCSMCGGRGERRDRSFSCQHCGIELHADVNAARNLLRRAGYRIEGPRRGAP